MLKIDHVEMITKDDCKFCLMAKNLLRANNVRAGISVLTNDELKVMYPQFKSVPQIWVWLNNDLDDKVHIGGYTELRTLFSIIELEQLLSNEVLNITFEKKNGEERTMKCTLKPDLLPPPPKENRGKKRNPWVIPVFDLDKQEFRSFRYENLLTYEVA